MEVTESAAEKLKLSRGDGKPNRHVTSCCSLFCSGINVPYI